jgi:hypothetical protein
MILRASGLGFGLWLLLTVLFRFAGEAFFLPDEIPRLIAFVLTFIMLRVLHEARGDEAEAAVAIAFPGMLLNAFVVHEFPRAFPNLDPTLDGAYGALALVFAASILFTGLMMTRLAPQDERV